MVGKSRLVGEVINKFMHWHWKWTPMDDFFLGKYWDPRVETYFMTIVSSVHKAFRRFFLAIVLEV